MRHASDGEIAALWARYRRDGQVSDRNLLIEHYARLVAIQAAHFSRKLPVHIGYDDLRSAGWTGLMEAIEAFDPARSARFETYCRSRIAGAILDWLRHRDVQSRTVRTFEKQRQHLQQMLGDELGRPASDDELADRMDTSRERYDRLLQRSLQGREVQFSSLEPGATGQPATADWRIDFPDETAEAPSLRIERAMLTEYLLRGLSQDERTLLTLYYYENLTMKEIALVLKVSESRVSQIHTELIARLRIRFRGKDRGQLVA